MHEQAQPDKKWIVRVRPADSTPPPEAFGAGRGPASDNEAFGRAEAPSKETPRRPDSPPEEEDRVPTERQRRGGEKPASAKEKEESKEEKNEDSRPEKKGPPLYRRPKVIIPTVIVASVLAVVGILWWLHARQFVSTDDAYIDGHVTQVSPQVAAPIKAMHADDNQFVHRGDLLVELDPTDFNVALDQARAAANAAEGKLAQARAQVPVAEATVQEADADIAAAQVNLDNATRDLVRYQSVDERARSRQQLDNATAAQKDAQAKVDAAKAKKASAEANVAAAQAAVTVAEGDLRKALADVDRANVNLGYTRITAPTDGRITLRTIEPGNYVQPGQAMFSIVAPDVWVTANFKETQLTRMRPGQPVTIEIDAYPDKKFDGHVDSIQAGSGSRFSMLPAENATGNFVKIVQRVPVKIVIDHLEGNTGDAKLLSPGLSVVPRVKVR